MQTYLMKAQANSASARVQLLVRAATTQQRRFYWAKKALLVAIVLAMALLAGPAQAKPDPGKAIADEAAMLFKERKFLEAAELFERSFALNPRKLVRLRNAGRAYEEAGRLEYACLIFERYLQQAPISAEKIEVKQRLARLHRLLELVPQPKAGGQPDGSAEEAKVPDKLPVSLSVPLEGGIAEEAGDDPQTLPWLVVASGAAIFLGGATWATVTELSASDVESKAAKLGSEYPGGFAKLEADRDDVRSARVLSWGTVGLGAAVLGGGLIWAWLPRSAEKAVLAPAANGRGLVLAWRF